jgi:hypothetical protein
MDINKFIDLIENLNLLKNYKNVFKNIKKARFNFKNKYILGDNCRIINILCYYEYIQNFIYYSTLLIFFTYYIWFLITLFDSNYYILLTITAFVFLLCLCVYCKLYYFSKDKYTTI